uniref:Uncharacterized protein n=1 Tax=Rhizophora mucronata TaxID=61149 RepID=A0A2P2LQH1_RHIMU
MTVNWLLVLKIASSTSDLQSPIFIGMIYTYVLVVITFIANYEIEVKKTFYKGLTPKHCVTPKDNLSVR